MDACPHCRPESELDVLE
ncbi:hypothetical protein [Streptomyces sp. NPDC059262]